MSTSSTRLNRYKYPGAKRLMLEAQELRETTEDYCAQPIDDNLFEWHFTVRGPPDTAFDGGYYHGSLSFPTEYPMKPPSIVMFTPNGRFQTNKKICLSISGYHPETWQPSWSVRTALVALIAFMPTKANRAIGSLDFSDAERKQLAIKSRTWRCETCGLIKDLLAHPHQEASNEEETIVGDGQESTSRVENQVDDMEDHSEQNNSQKSSEDKEVSDNTSDSQSIESGSNDDRSADSKANDETNGATSCNINETRNNTRESPSTSRESSPSMDLIRSDSSDPTQNLVLQNHAEGRRAYPTLVLKSIFTLLLLLILRRVVLVIQS